MNIVEKTNELSHRQKQLLEAEVRRLALKKRNEIKAEEGDYHNEQDKKYITEISPKLSPYRIKLIALLSKRNIIHEEIKKLEKEVKGKFWVEPQLRNEYGSHERDVFTNWKIPYNYGNQVVSATAKDYFEIYEKPKRLTEQVEEMERKTIANIWSMDSGDYADIVSDIANQFKDIKI